MKEKQRPVFNYKGNHFQGVSEGGICTSIFCNELDIIFDIGTLPFDYAHINNLFVSHAHLDHSAGIPYYISQRSLRKLKAPRIYVHEAMYENMQKVIELYSRMEDFTYAYELKSVEQKKYYTLGKNTSFMAWPTIHRIPSQAYTIFDRVNKLKPEYSETPREELLELKKKNIPITEERYTPLVSFSGDTRIEGILESKEALLSRVLFMECTTLMTKEILPMQENGDISTLTKLLPMQMSLKMKLSF